MVYHGQKAQGIEISLQISPMAKRIENAVTVAVGSFQHSGDGRFTRNSVRVAIDQYWKITRITDEAGRVLDSSRGDNVVE